MKVVLTGWDERGSEKLVTMELIDGKVVANWEPAASEGMKAELASIKEDGKTFTFDDGEAYLRAIAAKMARTQRILVYAEGL